MIKIESQLWSVINQNRAPLAYMCQVTQKKDGTPDSATQKKMETGRKWARNAEYRPYQYIDGEYVYGETIPANEGIEAFHDNVPMTGFKIAGEAGRWTTEATYIEVIDPRGFKVQVPVGNITTLMRTCDIIKGVIQEECVWGREDQHILLPVHSKEYKDAVGQIEKVEEALKLKDLVPGDWVKLHQHGSENKKEIQFLGMVKLEWTQHRTLYDLERDRQYSWHYYTKRVNERDDGSETLRDTQWVGLFADEVITTQLPDGFYSCGKQPKWKYGPTEPGVRIENASIKITARRSGEVPEVYAGLDGLNLALTKVVYYNKGRNDCPDRVMKRFEKQKYDNRYSREAVKDVIDTDYSAVVYLQA